MENGRVPKAMVIITLVLAFAGLGIGFSAFSSVLHNSLTAARTTASSVFNVSFTKTSPSIVCKTIPGESNNQATIIFSGIAQDDAITGVKVSFKEPNQKIICTATMKNSGEHTAYLKSIVSDGLVTCTPEEKATEGSVTSACENISVEVAAGPDKITTTSKVKGSTNVVRHSLSKNETETIKLTISYLSADDVKVDGPFTVSIPSVQLNYSPAD